MGIRRITDSTEQTMLELILLNKKIEFDFNSDSISL